MATPRRKTGEPQKTRQPLKIDMLPPAVREAIQSLYDRGRTWKEIEEQSALPYSKNWETDGAGFVEWESLALPVLEQFPQMRLPKSTLQRWFDLRIRQARAQVLKESAQARAFAAAFVDKNLPDANDAVINALRDQVFGMLESVGKGDKLKFVAALEDLTLAMTRMQRVQLQERRVAVDERKIAALEEREARARKSLDAETEDAAKKVKDGQFSIEDINRIRERVFGMPPIDLPRQAVAHGD